MVTVPKLEKVFFRYNCDDRLNVCYLGVLCLPRHLQRPYQSEGGYKEQDQGHLHRVHVLERQRWKVRASHALIRSTGGLVLCLTWSITPRHGYSLGYGFSAKST